VHVADPLVRSWKAELALGFERSGARTVLGRRVSDGPLVVQKALYPEGPEVCHAIVVHPPGGIAGGDELLLDVRAEGHALLTTPGAAKWYRSSGPWARQTLSFDVEGALEWLPRETIVFDGALAELQCDVKLGKDARYIGWEIICLGRSGSGEVFSRGRLAMRTRVLREGRLVWLERGEIEAGGALMRSPTGLGGHAVFGTLVATCDAPEKIGQCRALAATTALPGLVVARYLGDSTEAAFNAFAAIWALLRPAVADREAVRPRIWCT
jgi:urease accessory protein